MLVLRRKQGTSLRFFHADIGCEFTITVYEVLTRERVKLAITGPRTVIVERLAHRFAERVRRAALIPQDQVKTENGTITLTVSVNEPLMIMTSPYKGGKPISCTVIDAKPYTGHQSARLAIDCDKSIRILREEVQV